MRSMKILSILTFSLFLPSLLYAQRDIKDLRNTLEHAGNDTQKIDAYRGLIVYHASKQSDSVNYYAEQAFEYSRKKNFKLGEGLILAQLGVLDQNHGRVDLAKERTESALAIYREQHYLKGAGEMLNNLGTIEAAKGNFDIAMKYYATALKVYDSVVDYHGQMMVFMGMGSLYREHQDTANTRKYLNMGVAVSKKAELSSATIFLYNVVGVMYAEQGNVDTALQIFLNNLSISKKPEFMDAHLECLVYLSELIAEKGDTKSALQYLEEGAQIARANKIPEMETNILVDKAHIVGKSDPVLAIQYLNEAKLIAKAIKSKSYLTNIYGEIAALYERKGDYKNVFIATREKQKIIDSMYSMDKAKEIANIEAAYEFETNKRIKHLEILSLYNVKQRNLIIFIASVVAIVLIVLIFYYRKTTALNRQLLVRKQELRETNAMKDKLFSIIGHDLRGPVAAIPMILNLYENDMTDADEKKFLMDNLKEHVKASADTLDKLLFWGQSLVKGNLIKNEKINPKEFIRASIELKKVAAGEKHLTIKDNTPQDIFIATDPTHFDFIMRNLLDNAIKYSRANGTIEINADMQSKPGYIEFAIKDSGIGIDATILATVFKPQHSTPGTANEKGTGLGLMLCKEFAQLNGGDIRAESEPGKGSTFFFSVKKAG
jgi:signal transduction histidine kinase